MSGQQPYYGRHAASNEWATPEAVYRPLHCEFQFTLDVCATPENAKCERFFTETENGLEQEWRGVVWCNPPYGRQIGKWVAKASDACLRGAIVVMLLPSRTDTAWWHDYILAGRAEVRYIRGRIYFGDGGGRAPFPSVVVIFRPPSSIVCAPRPRTIDRVMCRLATGASS